MQLTKTLVRDFEKDKQWLMAMLSNIQRLNTSVQLREEPGEILITLLMKQEEIETAVVQATKEVFGNRVTVSDISVCNGGRIINLTFSNNCNC